MCSLWREFIRLSGRRLIFGAGLVRLETRRIASYKQDGSKMGCSETGSSSDETYEKSMGSCLGAKLGIASITI